MEICRRAAQQTQLAHRIGVIARLVEPLAAQGRDLVGADDQRVAEIFLERTGFEDGKPQRGRRGASSGSTRSSTAGAATSKGRPRRSRRALRYFDVEASSSRRGSSIALFSCRFAQK